MSQTHLLVSRLLTDAPGRWESWKEYVGYLGGSRWHLIIEGTDYSGMHTIAPTYAQMGTKALILWAVERDKDDAEGGESDQNTAADSEFNSDDDETGQGVGANPELGDRAHRLRSIARIVGATYCIKCISGYASGSWPTKPSAPRLLSINGPITRAIWNHVNHRVLDVTTTAGPAYLYPPDGERMAKIVMKSDSSHSMGIVTKLSKAQAAQAAALLQAIYLPKAINDANRE